MKRILSIVLSLAVVLSAVSGAFAKQAKTEKVKNTQKVQKVKKVKKEKSAKKVKNNNKKQKPVKKAKKNYNAKQRFDSNREFSTAQGYYEQGKDWDLKNNRPGSHVQFTKALNMNPNYDEAKLARAQAYYYNQNYDKSFDDFTYFYNNDEKYGAATFYEYRIECKKRQGLWADALDEMYEAILAYGGHTQLLNEMIQIIQEHPELSYKLNTASHQYLLAKHRNQASAIRDYAQLYKPNSGRVPNEDYYNFYINIAQTMNPDISLEVTPMAPLTGRVNENQGDVVDAIYE